MNENENSVAGYLFLNSYDYKEAKREAESVEYIKANTELGDINKVIKLYIKLVERKTLRTVVGYAFLNELRNQIIQSGIIGEDKLPKIQIQKEQAIRVYNSELERKQEEKHLAEMNEYKTKLRNSRIIIVFLTLIVLVMLVLSIFNERIMYTVHENQFIDQYANWQADLEEREAALKQKEKTLSDTP